MTFVKKSYSDITDTILSQITKGIVNEKHDYVINRTKYQLAHPRVLEIIRIYVKLNNKEFNFRKDTDYRVIGNMIEWLNTGEKPDDHTPFFVNYKIDSQQLITDINPGSVIRTIIESVAMEIDLIYSQMDQIYNSGFIDTATGKSLDLVVSILGIVRKTAGFATGEVTFVRNSEPGEIEILHEAHFYDVKNKFKKYELKNSMVKGVKIVDGTSGGTKSSFIESKDYALSGNAILWIEGGRQPDEGSVFYADYMAYEEIKIPAETMVSTYSRMPENLKKFRTIRESILIKNQEGRWEIEVPVMAMSPGKEGNVFAGSINVMPKPLMGIEYVINKKDILNGTEEEGDSALRDRAKRELEKAGKASLTSLKSAVEGVKGVIGDVKVVDQPDGVPGIVQIIASGGDENKIKNVIEETRSAGIKVEFKRPRIIPLDIDIIIEGVEGMDFEDLKKNVDKEIRNYIAAQNIDDDIILSHIVKSALNVQGIKDVHDIKINGENNKVEVKFDEKVELRRLEIFPGESFAKK